MFLWMLASWWNFLKIADFNWFVVPDQLLWCDNNELKLSLKCWFVFCCACCGWIPDKFFCVFFLAQMACWMCVFCCWRFVLDVSNVLTVFWCEFWCEFFLLPNSIVWKSFQLSDLIFDVNVLVLMQWKSIRLQFRFFWCDVTCQPSGSWCDVGEPCIFFLKLVGWPVCFLWWFLTLFEVSNVVLMSWPSSFARFVRFADFAILKLSWNFFDVVPMFNLIWCCCEHFSTCFSNFLRFWCWISDPALALKGTGGSWNFSNVFACLVNYCWRYNTEVLTNKYFFVLFLQRMIQIFSMFCWHGSTMIARWNSKAIML